MKKECPYHEQYYDSSYRYDDKTCNDLYPIGYERRWRKSNNSKNDIIAILPCLCGKGYFPEKK